MHEAKYEATRKLLASVYARLTGSIHTMADEDVDDVDQTVPEDVNQTVPDDDGVQAEPEDDGSQLGDEDVDPDLRLQDFLDAIANAPTAGEVDELIEMAEGDNAVNDRPRMAKILEMAANAKAILAGVDGTAKRRQFVPQSFALERSAE